MISLRTEIIRACALRQTHVICMEELTGMFRCAIIVFPRPTEFHALIEDTTKLVKKKL